MDTAALLSARAVQQKTVLTIELLEATLAALEVLPSRIAELKGLPHSPDIELLFAGRRLEDGKKLSDYFGKHEKSKVKVTLCDMPANASPRVEDPNGPTTDAGAIVQPPEGHGGTPSAPGHVQVEPPAHGVSLSSFFRRSQDGDEPVHEEAAEVGEDQDEDAPLLSASQAAKLTESRSIRDAIRDPRLQEVLRHVDSAPTREGALCRLEQALKDPEFEAFSTAALREIGWATAIEEGDAA